MKLVVKYWRETRGHTDDAQVELARIVFCNTRKEHIQDITALKGSITFQVIEQEGIPLDLGCKNVAFGRPCVGYNKTTLRGEYPRQFNHADSYDGTVLPMKQLIEDSIKSISAQVFGWSPLNAGDECKLENQVSNKPVIFVGYDPDVQNILKRQNQSCGGQPHWELFYKQNILNQPIIVNEGNCTTVTWEKADEVSS